MSARGDGNDSENFGRDGTVTNSARSSFSYVTVDWCVPCAVIPRLWIGRVDADSVDTLVNMRISHVLFLTPEIHLNTFEGLQLRQVDDPNEGLIFSWVKSLEFIADGRQSGGILVDISDSQRCSSTIVAYLVEALGMSLEGALVTIRKSLRDLPEPTGVFIEQLRQVERWCISRFDDVATH